MQTIFRRIISESYDKLYEKKSVILRRNHKKDIEYGYETRNT